jgi:hypothetical protein
MRSSIGPPGPDLDFVTWTVALVGYLSGLLPGVAAARKRGSVILRYERRRATIRDEGAVRRVTLGTGTDWLIDRLGESDAYDVATSLAGFLDGVPRAPR